MRHSRSTCCHMIRKWQRTFTHFSNIITIAWQLISWILTHFQNPRHRLNHLVIALYIPPHQVSNRLATLYEHFRVRDHNLRIRVHLTDHNIFNFSFQLSSREKHKSTMVVCNTKGNNVPQLQLLRRKNVRPKKNLLPPFDNLTLPFFGNREIVLFPQLRAHIPHIILLNP